MTQLTRRTPNRTVRDLQREVDSIFDQFFGRGSDDDTSAVWAPRTDLSETDDAFRIRLDVPGMTKDDIAINLQNNTLTVSGERSSERQEDGESTCAWSAPSATSTGRLPFRTRWIRTAWRPPTTRAC